VDENQQPEAEQAVEEKPAVEESVEETAESEGPKNSGKAVTSLVLGIIAILLPGKIISGPLAIIFGLLGRKNIKAEPDQFKGAKLALIGIILGAIGLVIRLIMVANYMAKNAN